MLNFIIWLSKHIALSHYGLFLHLTHSQQRLLEIERKREQMRRRLFEGS
jgi:hypothetical protein